MFDINHSEVGRRVVAKDKITYSLSTLRSANLTPIYSMHTKEYTLEIGGKIVTALFSSLAEQANGSVILKCDGTVVMATACMSKDGKNNPGFFNLTVEYLEKFYASGKILGSQFMRREGRPSDQATLAARMTDRTIRPLFEHHIKNAVQVIITVIAVGGADPKILGVNAASLAIAVSDIPWAGPIGAVAMTRVKGTEEILVNGYAPQTTDGVYDFDLMVCGNNGTINMIEAMTYEASEELVGQKFDEAVTEITKLENWQKSIVAEIGKAKKEFPKMEAPAETKALFAEKIVPTLMTGLFGPQSKDFIHGAEDDWATLVDETYPDDEALRHAAKDYAHEAIDELVHRGALEENKRVDLRAFDEVRPLFAQAGGISPVLHGSGIFYRGETHVLNVLTLAGPDSTQMVDGVESEHERRFMHHYNFPPYSVGETGRVGSTGRREMGHGFLAEKALVPVIPSKDVFPYTIRLVSESVASNGSTSQASICASTIALMDGGVPIKAPVAGVSVGLMMDTTNPKNYKLLTDIQGPEDHFGDMDFKVAGTKDGITAIQLDIKVGGIPADVLKDALQSAKKGRLHILEAILAEIPAPRADISPNAPKIISTKIDPTQIGMVIGSGGKTVNAIREKSGAEITIEDDGTVFATGKNGAAEKAIEMIKGMTREWKMGDEAEGTIIKIIEVGAIVALSEFAEGMVHVSEIAPFRVEKVADVLAVGQVVPVKVLAVDKERGRISLSIKARNADFVKNPKA